MSRIRIFLKEHFKTIERIQSVLVIIFASMILVDIVLAVFFKNDLPTFSEVVYAKRTQWIWLNFLLGGLTAKIFYNRKVFTKRKEISGFFGFVAICLLLAVLGQLLPNDLDTYVYFLIMISGGLMAHFAWPQYIYDETD